MTTEHSGRSNRILARLLWHGTCCASTVVAAGLLLKALQGSSHSEHGGISGDSMLRAGVGMFIFLPVCRVVLMLVLFLRERDYVYAFISALVLTIIAVGFAFGISGR